MTDAPTNDFSRAKYRVVRCLVGDPVRSFLRDYVLGALRAGKLEPGDDRLLETPCCYADPMMEWLLEALVGSVASASGLALLPTYSYLRVYRTGDALVRHQDRPSCEVSVTLSLDYHPEACWPIWIDAGAGARSIELHPGDALIYKGIEVPHWRERFEGERAVQVFLHYVQQTGPYRDWTYDRRAGLRISPAARRIMEAVRGAAPLSSAFG